MAYLPLGTVSVRGKQVGTRIYALLGDRSAAETTAFRHLLARHAELMAALDARDTRRAKELLESLRGLGPDDLSGHLDYLSGLLEAMTPQPSAPADGTGTPATPPR